ncbi:nucleolar protein 9-like [Amphiura filiformis]|uniref:nucleolar protein 9-like n=1 Tax=Amphiura filiformis TaxID=82378 RepID=UPI003B2203F5
MSAHMKQKRVQFGKKPHHKKYHKSFDESEDSGSGRIGRLDDDTMGYYRRVSEALTEGFQDQTEQELFVSNVFAQVEKQELKVSQNQTVSHIMEKLLGMSSGKQLSGFLQGLHEAGDVCNAAKDRFAAHVLQTAILTAVPFVEDPDCGSDVQTVLLAVCKAVTSKVNEFVYHTYAAHVLSAVVEVLAGVKVPEQVTRSRLSQGQMHAKDHGREPKVVLKKVPVPFLDELRRTVQVIMQVDSIVDLLLNQVASPVVAVLLLVLKTADADLHRELCKLITKSCKLQAKQLNENTPPAMLTHPIASHVMEVLIQTSPDDQFNKLCSSCFKGRYKQVALHATANFVLQRVITRAVHTDMFEELFSELSSCIEDMLAVNHLGVVIRLAEACVQRPTQQGALMVALLKAFHCDAPKERQPTCVVLIASLTTYEIYFGEDTKEDEGDKEGDKSQTKSSKKSLTINFHGSLLLQQLLKFKNCASISAGFLAMTPDDLVAMACDPAGSFLLEAFMTSGVNEKKKDKLIDRLKGHCIKVACNRNGSRTIDSLFAAASMRSKFTIAEELAAKIDQLAGDQFGRHVHRNCALNHFKYRRGQWKELQGRETKKRKLFAEIIGEEEDSTKKKKKKKDKRAADDVYYKEMVVLGVGMSDEHMEEDADKDQRAEQQTKDEDDIQDIFKKMTKSPEKKQISPTEREKVSKHKRTDVVSDSNADSEQRTSTHESHGKSKKKKKKKQK